MFKKGIRLFKLWRSWAWNTVASWTLSYCRSAWKTLPARNIKSTVLLQKFINIIKITSLIIQCTNENAINLDYAIIVISLWQGKQSVTQSFTQVLRNWQQQPENLARRKYFRQEQFSSYYALILKKFFYKNPAKQLTN